MNPLIVWSVAHGGPEGTDGETVYFMSRDDALTEYRARKMRSWQDHAAINLLGSSRTSPDELGDDRDDARGGLYCKLGNIHWIGLTAILVVPASPVVSESHP